MGRNKDKELSQAEIWDDSALLQSWNDALAEYKLYHSIHARGERVEDVINSMEVSGDGVVPNCNALPRESTTTTGNGAVARDLEDGELEEAPEDTGPVHNGDLGGNTQAPSAYNAHQSHSHPKTNAIEQQHQAPSVPDAIMNGVNDEALRNLMMSWYYAGYYTGLYNGQQAQNSMPK